MQQRESQRHQVFHHLPLAELIDLNRLECDAMALQRSHDFDQMRARPNQHREATIARGAVMDADQLDHAIRFFAPSISRLRECMHADVTALGGGAWNAAGVRYCARFDVVGGRQDRLKRPVHPFHNFRAANESSR